MDMPPFGLFGRRLYQMREGESSTGCFVFGGTDQLGQVVRRTLSRKAKAGRFGRYHSRTKCNDSKRGVEVTGGTTW